MRKNQRGFSLIELLIVVSIILIIAAIAIPNLISARMAANESSSVASLRTLQTACETYSNYYGVGYPAALANMGPAAVPSSTSADLIDSNLASGTKSGYSFVYTPGAPDVNGFISSYTINANPLSSSTGTRYFYVDQSAVLTYAYGAPASITDTPL